MLILYDFGNSVCCQKVRITLVEKGLTWEARRVDLFKTEQYDPEYLKLNPKGVVPTLVHDGTPVIESTLICEYIDETFPVACGPTRNESEVHIVRSGQPLERAPRRVGNGGGLWSRRNGRQRAVDVQRDE